MLLALASLTACSRAPAREDTPSDPLSYGAALVATCAGCHSTNMADMPDISDWSAEQIKHSLTTYRESEGDTVMHRLAKGYSDEDIAAIAAQWGMEE